MIKLNKDERIDDLQFKNLKIIQNKNKFCFGIDSVILSDFAKDIKKGSKVLDLGTGTGIIGTLLCEKTELKEIIGIEIQTDMADMAKRSIKLNKLENKFQILNEDIKNIDKIFEEKSIDSIVTNPPYKKTNTGIKNINESILISKNEIKCNLKDIIQMSNKLLKENGSIYMVHRPERLAEIIEILKYNKLEPKKMALVYNKIEQAPILVLIKAIKLAKPFLTILPPIIIYDENKNYTEQILKIYNKNK